MGGGRMVKRFNLQAIVLIPLAGTYGNCRPLPPPASPMTHEAAALVQSLPQQIGEEMVIAVPAPLVVQGDEEQVGVFEVVQGCLPGSGGIAQHGIAQGAAQAVEDRRAQQERLDARGLLVQDFFDQIVQHEMVGAGERSDEAGGVVMSLQGERGQLQAGNPAFGAVFQGGDVRRREVEAHHRVEKSGGFGGGETQVGGAQFGQLAPGAEPGQGERRILAGGDDQVHLRRQVLEQKGEGLVDRPGLDQRGSRPGRGRTCPGGWRSH